MVVEDVIQSTIETIENIHRKRNSAEFNKVIERYICLAHGLPPADDHLSQFPENGKNKARTNHSSPLHRLPRTNAASRTTSASQRRDSCFDEEDDFVQEVEESLQRRRRQLGLSDDFPFGEVDDDDDDPDWDGSYTHARRNGFNRLPKKRRRKGKLTGNENIDNGKLQEENKERKTSAEQVSGPQSIGAKLKQAALQYRFSGSDLLRKNGKPLKEKKISEACDKGTMPRKRSKPCKAKAPVVVENQENNNQGSLSSGLASSDKSPSPRKRGRLFRKKTQIMVENKENFNRDNLNSGSMSSDKSTPPRKRIRRKAELECLTENNSKAIENKGPRKSRRQSKEKVLKDKENNIQSNTGSSRMCSKNLMENIQPSDKEHEARGANRSGGTDEQRFSISDSFMELVRKAVGGSVGILHVTCEENNNILCLSDSMDVVRIKASWSSPHGGSDGRITQKVTEREESVRVHISSGREAGAFQEKAARLPVISQEQKMNDPQGQHRAKNTRTKPSKRPATEAHKDDVGRKRGTSNSRTTLSLPSKNMQHPEVTTEHSPLHKNRQGNSQSSEDISELVARLPRTPKSHSSISFEGSAAAHPAKEVTPLSSGQTNSDVVSSTTRHGSKRSHVDPDGKSEVTPHFIELISHNSSKSPLAPSREPYNSNIDERNLSKSTSEASERFSGVNLESKARPKVHDSEVEVQDEEWTTTDDEDEDTILKLTSAEKKKSFLRRSQSSQKRIKHRRKSKRSVSKVLFNADDDDDGSDDNEVVVIMKPPKPILLENQNDITSENTVRTQGVTGLQDNPFTSAPLVNNTHNRVPKKNVTPALGHQRSFISSSTYSQILVNSSMMRNVPTNSLTTSSPKAPLEDQEQEEEEDPEDVFSLLQVPSLGQLSFAAPQTSVPSTITSTTTTTTSSSTQGSKEATVTALLMPPLVIATATGTTITTTTTNVTDSGVASKVSNTVKSFWDEESDEEVEVEENNKDNQETESLFGVTTFSSTLQVSQSSLAPSFSTLGAERWMLAMRTMHQRRKSSFLRLPLQ